MFMHFSCICTFKFLYSYILSCFCFSNCLSLFLALVCSMAPKNSNPLCPRTLFVLGHPFLPMTLHLLMYGSVIKPKRTLRRTFLDEVVIWNAKSSYWIFLILTYPLSFTVGVGGHYVTSWSLVPP